MIFDPAYLVQYLSQFMTLEAGDLISTGIGLGQKTPVFLQAGTSLSFRSMASAPSGKFV